MNKKNYFHRVNELTPTRFWINNVTTEEAHIAIAEGAIGCTQNPSYVWKMLTNPEMKEKTIALIKEYGKTSSDIDEILVNVQRDLVYDISKIFLPLYEASNGMNGYVSIQGDPFHEDTESIIKYARFNFEKSPNIMAKIPVTEEGLEAIAVCAAEGIPINATEVMAVKQALDVCDVYTKATKGLKNKAPIYFSHITGIYDEYLVKTVEKENIDVQEDILWQAGMAIAKKTYWMAKERNKEVGFIGGGARGLHHFTEMVGADANITINWIGSAKDLIDSNPVVVDRFNTKTPDYVIDELCEKLPDFKKGYFVNEIESHEYETFGPVVLFRVSFEEAWEKTREAAKEILGL